MLHCPRTPSQEIFLQRIGCASGLFVHIPRFVSRFRFAVHVRLLPRQRAFLFMTWKYVSHTARVHPLRVCAVSTLLHHTKLAISSSCTIVRTHMFIEPVSANYHIRMQALRIVALPPCAPVFIYLLSRFRVFNHFLFSQWAPLVSVQLMKFTLSKACIRHLQPFELPHVLFEENERIVGFVDFYQRYTGTEVASRIKRYSFPELLFGFRLVHS